ncbi:BPSL0067 family protein [Massilia endophytica]|uniref:BPSL0067 family protein n=1 Tax=Massilia endophytica TaxID=2899220 RepID=UPI003898F0E3
MPRPAVYQGNLEALLLNWKEQETPSLASGECARLPQVLTDVGHTSRWHRGPRVVDSPNLLAGTVIANFKLRDGRWVFPNEQGWHAGLFYRFEGRRVMSNGLPCVFSMIDQWLHKAPGLRGLAILPDWFRAEHPNKYVPSNRADEFYVVLVP